MNTTPQSGSFYVIRKGKPEESGKTKYPFKRMQPGTYFDVPIERRKTMYVFASQYGKLYGHKFSIRTLDAERVRVYCVA